MMKSSSFFETFRKRPGTTNKGTEYETFNIANLILTLIGDKNIKNFYISSNNEEFGAFDDIVVEIELENGNEVYALQLKHNDRGNLALDKLKNRKGDFSISKYFDSYQSIKHKTSKFVLFTNLEFAVENSSRIQLEGEDFCIQLLRISTNEVFKISEKSDFCYKFRVVKDPSVESSTKIQEYETFFERFFLYVGQDSLACLKINTATTFKNMFLSNDTEFDQYLKFISEWSMKEGKKEKLNKTWMQRVIALQLLSSRIRPLSFNSINEKMKILREAISNFDVTVFGQKSYDAVKTLWGDVKSEFKDTKRINRIREKYQVYPTFIDNLDTIDDTVLSKLLWLDDQCPLVVVEDGTVEKAVQLCYKEKFILVGENLSSKWILNKSVFKNMSDLKVKSEVYQKIAKAFTCTLQEKQQITLKTLIGSNEVISKLIKTDNLLEMLFGPLNIGGAKETLPFPYVERVLLKPIIDIKCLEKVDQNTLIVIYGVDKVDALNAKFQHQNCIDFLNGSFDAKNRRHSRYVSLSKKTKEKRDIYITKEDYNQYSFEKLYEKIKWTKNCHHFRLTEDENLEWLQSKDTINDLENYRLPEDHVVSTRENILWNPKPYDNINLIIGDPGMGKTELLRNFINNSRGDFWTILINSNDIDEFFEHQEHQNNDVHAFEEFIVEHKHEKLNNLDKELLRIKIQQNSVFFVWDALDEVYIDYMESTTNIILRFSERKIVQWVTSRSHLRKYLETKLNVLSMNMKQFNEEEQISYVKERLQESSENINDIFAKIKSSFAVVEHKDILGIPLQLFMLTTLFRQNREKYLHLLSETFVLTDLYHWFIEEKFKLYFKEKLGINLVKAKLKTQNNFFKIKTLECYEILALKTLFPEEYLKKLSVDIVKDLRTIQENNSAIGLITDFVDQVPRFLHTSFAEYLVAVYFSKNLFFKNNIADMLFDEKYTNVRFFFDLLLSKNSLSHIAVLYKNYGLLEQCGNEIETRKDDGGRTALHTACSWGTRYPRLNVEKNNEAYVIDDSNVLRVTEEETDYLRVIKTLSKYSQHLVQDELYGVTPISYAQMCNCFITVLGIVKDQNMSLQEICDDSEVANILYYSAIFGYDRVIDLFASDALPFIETKSSKSTLLHLSVDFIDFVRELLRVESYKSAINTGDNEGQTPLYLASKNGNEETVEFLISQEAGVNIAEASGATPLHTASDYGHEEIVELLIANGAEVNRVDKDGCPPLLGASQFGSKKIVELLIAAGANANFADPEGFTPLHYASQGGHKEVVEILIASGAKVILGDQQSYTPLHIASEHGHVEIVDILITSGANVNCANKHGFTPVHIAAHKGHEEIVKSLMASGAKVNCVNKEYATPLQAASAEGHLEIVECLIAGGAKVNFADEDGFTPLHFASQDGHDEVVKCLIASGGNVNAPNRNGFTPLHSASMTNQKTVAEILLACGGDIDFAGKPGSTPLHFAAHRGHEKMVEFLTANGAKVNVTAENGFTPLHVASCHGRTKVVEFLTATGACVNLGDKDGFTPLHLASQHGHEEIVDILVASGAEVNRVDEQSYTPLHIASEYGHADIVDTLTTSGAEVNLTNEDGFTPLHIAALKGFEDVANLLIASGTEVNLTNKENSTPLHAASDEGHREIIESLIASGAKVNLADEDGFTPLYFASQSGHKEVVEFLIASGAIVNLPTNLGFTPLHSASKMGHEKVVEVLVASGAEINRAAKLGCTPLYVAAHNGHGEIVEFLTANGAEVNVAAESGGTPLHVAAENGHEEIVKFLIASGADINLEDKDGFTPLHFASQNGHESRVFD